MEARLTSECAQCLGRILSTIALFSDSFFISLPKLPWDGQSSLNITALCDLHSAFASVTLRPSFFLDFRVHDDAPQHMQVPVEPVCERLKAHNKGVDYVTIHISGKNAPPLFTLSFMLIARIRIRHKLYTYGGQPPRRPMKYDNVQTWEAMPQVFLNWLRRFPTKVNELTLRMAKDKVSLEGSIGDEPTTGLTTVLQVAIEDFEVYNILETTRVTIKLKWLKKIFTLASSMRSPVQCLFPRQSDKPVLFKLDVPEMFESEFTLASLVYPPDESESVDNSIVTDSTVGRMVGEASPKAAVGYANERPRAHWGNPLIGGQSLRSSSSINSALVPGGPVAVESPAIRRTPEPRLRPTVKRKRSHSMVGVAETDRRHWHNRVPSEDSFLSSCAGPPRKDVPFAGGPPPNAHPTGQRPLTAEEEMLLALMEAPAHDVDYSQPPSNQGHDAAFGVGNRNRDDDDEDVVLDSSPDHVRGWGVMEE